MVVHAAAVFRGLNVLFEMNLGINSMCKMAEKLGSDISFCLLGGTMLATGRGEILQEIAAMPTVDMILVKPKFAVSTPWVYKNYHKVETKVVLYLNNKLMRKALLKKDIQEICNNLGNVLEMVTIPEYPEIKAIKKLFVIMEQKQR